MKTSSIHWSGNLKILGVTKFRKGAHSADAESRSAVGLGTDHRIESKKVTGFALALEDQILHVPVFAREITGLKNTVIR